MAKKRKKHNPTNMWDFLLVSTQTAINKGQLLLFGYSIVLVVMALRIPADKLGELADKIIDNFVKFQSGAWVLLLLALFFTFFYVKNMRRRFSKEYRRIGKEKSDMQQGQSPIILGSSDKL